MKTAPRSFRRRGLRRVSLEILALEQRLAPAIINVNPTNYLSLVPTAHAGDTVQFAAGNYTSGLNLSGMNGTASAPITLDGSAGTVILGTTSQNTVELDSTSYLIFENFTVNSQNLNDGIKAGGGLSNVSHDISIKNNTILNCENPADPQQTVGISTKCIAWNWTIEGNTIQNAGTGLYLGDSSGFAPFINGVIENNTVENTIGYGMEIKDQEPYSLVSGMPSGPHTTIVRNNVFADNDTQATINGVGPDGARPNLMIGGFPASGPGSTDTYQIYGNVLDNNVSAGDYLLQVTGRASIHDNILVNDSVGGIHIQAHYDDSGILFSPQQISVYDNTIYDVGTGISGAASWPVVGNLIFASNSGAPGGNIADSIANAGLYVTNPSTVLGSMNFTPLPGKCQGAAVNLSQFASDVAYNVDFSGNTRPASDTTYGAYEGSIPQPPAAPAGLTATPGDGQVALSWSGSTGATSYNVYRWNGSSYVRIQNVGGTSTSDTGLTDGTTYWYEVTAVNGAGESAASNQVSATPQAVVTVPATPTNLTATAGDGQVALSWSSSTGATSYNVYRWNGSGWAVIQNVSGTSTSDTGLTDGTTYYYEVSAVNSAGESSPTNYVAVTPEAVVTVPATPTNLTATAGDGQVALSWSGSTGATSYNVYRWNGSGWVVIQNVSGTSTSDTGLTDGTTYYYEVSAVNSAGESSPTNYVAAAPEPPAPAAPTNLTATAGNGQVSLSWSAASGAASYNVYRWNGSSYALIQNVGGTSATDTGLTNGTTYWYEVTAVNGGGASGPSNQVSATPQAAKPPTIVHPAAASPSVVTGKTSKTSKLSALGADASGASSLVYTWSVLSMPGGAANPTFSANGTNAARNTTVTFHAAGSYRFRVTITDPAGLSVTSDVAVTVQQTLSSIRVTGGGSVKHGTSKQFAAAAYDQFAALLAVQPTFVWSVASGLGTISSTGLYHAPSTTGTATVQASSGTVKGTAKVSVK